VETPGRMLSHMPHSFLRARSCQVILGASSGTVHEAPEDLQAAVRSVSRVLVLWEGLTALGRNEFICWVLTRSVLQPAIDALREHVRNSWKEKKRPCC